MSCLTYFLVFTCRLDLHTIGGLVPLLAYLKNSHANIRAKAADVVTTIVQNNPRSQQLVMEANGFEPLVSNFSSDPDVNVRAKALGAISCMYYYLIFCYEIWFLKLE
jgi:hsp70-interacting protein